MLRGFQFIPLLAMFFVPLEANAAPAIVSQNPQGVSVGTVGQELAGEYHWGQKIYDLNQHAAATAAVGAGAGCLGSLVLAPLTCAGSVGTAIGLYLTEKGLLAEFGLLDDVDCEVTCTADDGTRGGAAMSTLLASWFNNGSMKGLSDSVILQSFMNYVQSPEGSGVEQVQVAYIFNGSTSVSQLAGYKRDFLKALRCIRSCNARSTVNFIVNFLANLYDAKGYGVAIIGTILLGTTVEWGKKIHTTSVPASKLGVMINAADILKCSNTKYSVNCTNNFNFLNVLYHQALNPSAALAAVGSQ